MVGFFPTLIRKFNFQKAPAQLVRRIFGFLNGENVIGCLSLLGFMLLKLFPINLRFV